MESSAVTVTLKQINWTLAWFVSIFILYTKYSLLFPLMSNTHMHTQRLYIDLNRGMITRGRGLKHKPVYLSNPELRSYGKLGPSKHPGDELDASQCN